MGKVHDEKASGCISSFHVVDQAEKEENTYQGGPFQSYPIWSIQAKGTADKFHLWPVNMTT